MAEVCEITQVDEKGVKYVKERLANDDVTHRVTELFKALADPQRIRIIEALSLKELCVCDLATLLELTQSATSHQLRTLRQSGIVKYRKVGRVVYYSLDDEHVSDIVSAVYKHIDHS